MCVFASLFLQLISFSCKEETSWQNKTKLTTTGWERLLQLLWDHLFCHFLHLTWEKCNEVHFKTILKMHVAKLDFIPLWIFFYFYKQKICYILSHFSLIKLSVDMCLRQSRSFTLARVTHCQLESISLYYIFFIFKTEGFGSNLIGTKLKNIISTVF